MIKKEKIFELKIQEDDDVSGIDSISLVDEPAIEVNWVAFKKEKEHEFHIPDGEDNKYLEKLMSKAQLEEDLLSEGYEFYKVIEEDFISTDPNDDSREDTDFYRVRYKYDLSPNINQNKIIPTTRAFCRDLCSKNFVWRDEDIEAITNDFGDSARLWRGGYNCRHRWFKILYKKTGSIINKASINKDKITGPQGVPVYGTPDFLQPNTVTGPTLANPSPSTIKNLGLSKEGFAKPKVSVDYDGTLSTDKGKELYKELVDAGNDVYIVTARNEKEGEPILALAKELRIPQDRVLFTDGGPKSEVLKRIGITKHYDNNPDVVAEIKKNAPEVDAIKFGYDVGGLPPYVDQLPKKKKVLPKGLLSSDFEYLNPSQFKSYSDYPESAKNNACKVLRWREEHGDEVDGMTQVGWTRANQLCNGENISEETISRMASFARHRQNAEVSEEFKSTPWKDRGYVAWLGWGGTSGIEWAQKKLESIRNEMSKQHFATDNEKHIVLGPAMIPDQKIFRKDALGNPYYVFFSPETIRMIAEKYMRNKYTDNNDTMHDGKAIKDIHVLESWIKEDQQDKSNKYGFENLPIGTWFVSMKVNNPKVWEEVKQGKLNGFSVSGYFEEVAQFSREEMFLYKVAEILKKVKE